MHFQSYQWHHSSLTFSEVWLFCWGWLCVPALSLRQTELSGCLQDKGDFVTSPRLHHTGAFSCVLCKHAFVFINCIVGVPNARLCFIHLWSTVWLSSWPLLNGHIFFHAPLQCLKIDAWVHLGPCWAEGTGRILSCVFQSVLPVATAISTAK